MPKLSILIINYNSADFVANSLFCLQQLTYHPYQVFVLDNNSRPEDIEKLESLSLTYPNLTIIKENTDLTGSLAHGTALNKLVTKVNTPYFSILDADATWLKKDWDKILINQLTDQIKVIGTQADGTSKPQDFPLMYAILFETNSFKKLNIDFRPQSANQDTGFDMREKYLSANLQGKVLTMKNTRHFKQGPFHQLIGVGEYYQDNTLFTSHFGRGSSLGSAKYYKSWLKWLYRLPYLGAWFIKLKGQSEKNKWIAICQQIANQQNYDRIQR